MASNSERGGDDWRPDDIEYLFPIALRIIGAISASSRTCEYGRDEIHGKVIEVLTKIVVGRIVVANGPEAIPAFLHSTGRHQAIDHLRRCITCQHRAVPIGPIDDGGRSRGTDPPGPQANEPEWRADHVLDRELFRAAIRDERAQRPSCPWHHGRACWRSHFDIEKLAQYVEHVRNRDEIITELSDLLEIDGGYKRETATRLAARQIACFDWWVYIGHSAQDDRPLPSYEADLSLHGIWPTVKGEPMKRTMQAIGPYRYWFLSHFKATNGNWTRAEYLLSAAVKLYSDPSRVDLKRVIDYQRHDIRTIIRDEIDGQAGEGPP